MRWFERNSGSLTERDKRKRRGESIWENVERPRYQRVGGELSGKSGEEGDLKDRPEREGL